MKEEQIKEVGGKTAIQSFADWLAMEKEDRFEKFQVSYTKTAFIIRRITPTTNE